MMKSMNPVIAVLAFILPAVFPSCDAQETSFGRQNVITSLYGEMDSGREIRLHKLVNQSGMTAEIIEYGATLVSMTVPDRQGTFSDVVLGYDSLSHYRDDDSYFGSIVGRFGNRIAGGCFILNGMEYQLAANDGGNHLHGGVKGFNKQVWDSEIIDREAGPAVRLTYISPDGEEGYPGEVSLSVTYTLSNRNELCLEYEGRTTKPTIVNPTSHIYFNLSGNPERSVLNHELMIAAEMYVPVDNGLIPLGELSRVAGTPMDFRNPVPVGARINAQSEQLEFARGYDHNWVPDHFDGTVRNVASLYDPESGRLMEILTDQPGLQFYSGNFLDGTITGKDGIRYKHRTGLCLEAQFFPDSPNREKFPSVALYPGEEYSQTTIYRFSVQ